MRQTIIPDEQQVQVPHPATVRRSRASFESFYDKYDALIGLLCLAAREGVSLPYERHYFELRTWFVRRYPSTKPNLSVHIVPDSRDCYFKSGNRIECDAFEALYLPKTIGSMFDHDGGALIDRMMRTQSALGLWDNSLARAESECRLMVARSEFRQNAIPAF